MTKELKAYEDRKDYTVKGEQYDKGLEDLLLNLQATADIDYTIYIDTVTGDIDAMPSCNFRSLADTYYGRKVAISDWKADGGDSRLGEAYTYDELEDYASEEDVKELRKKFEEEHKDDLDDYEDIEDFYNDFADDYKEFLFNAENEAIDKGVDEFSRESIDIYIDQFDEAYAALLENKEF